ncbi:hypothetical protein BU15DRAFT_17532, partial [Melanogaster broomeanus]
EKREPIRCAQCQKWGHIARDCTATYDTCAICGHTHRKEDCSSFKTYYCVGCDANDHSSNDPHCPTYLAKRAEMDAKYPENRMPYFPTDE